jgi:rhodanese-related sulfurtransferase
MNLWLYIHKMNVTPDFSPSAARKTSSAPASVRSTSSTVPVGTLATVLRGGGVCRIVDVRTAPEFAAAHIAGSVNQPLDVLNPADWSDGADGAAQGLRGIREGATSDSVGAGVGAGVGAADRSGPLYVLCQAGGRAGRAGEILAKAGVANVVVEGGLDAWTAAGLPVERGASRVLPLMRQVQIVIGLVSGTGAALAIFKHPLFALIPLFMAVGLLFAGLSGTCGLALFLARMPWNRRPQSSGGGPAAPAAPVTTAGSPSCCAPAPLDRSVSSAGGAR